METSSDDNGDSIELAVKLTDAPKNRAQVETAISAVKSQAEQLTVQVSKKMVTEKMHRAMSPISAISGYLELMEMLLEKDPTNDSIERYRSKIEEGIGEVGEIIEELHEVFADSEPPPTNGTTDFEDRTGRRAS